MMGERYSRLADISSRMCSAGDRGRVRRRLHPGRKPKRSRGLIVEDPSPLSRRPCAGRVYSYGKGVNFDPCGAAIR